jgi:polysaccharide biosynthesis protein PslH
MRILMMTGSLPYPPHQGGAIRAFGLLNGLYEAGHKVTLLSFHDVMRGVRVENTPLARLCEQVITVPMPSRGLRDRLVDLVFSAEADIARRLASDEMQALLRQKLSEQAFDLVQFEGIEIANYLLAAQAIQPNTPMVYDAFNAEATLQADIARVDRESVRRLPNAIYSEVQARRIKTYEARICRAATAVIAVSEEDAAILRRYRGDEGVYVVPSGVFVDHYATPSERLDLKTNALVFTGKMDYRPNVDAMMWFASEVLPGVVRHVDAHLYIVGQKPHKRLDGLRMNPHIAITGWVAEVQPYLHAATVYVAPLRMGSGTRLKLLEAMAAGCAVVASPTGAAGLMQDAKAHMIICEEPAEMANGIRGLLAQPEQRKVMGGRARQYIREHYDWAVLTPKLLTMYKAIGLHDG